MWNLESARVHHDAEGTRDGLGGKVVTEHGSDDTAVTVDAGDGAPDSTALAAGLLASLLCLVDIGDTLAEIVAGVLLAVDTLDTDESLSLILVTHATLVTKENSTGVKTSLHYIYIQ